MYSHKANGLRDSHVVSEPSLAVQKAMERSPDLLSQEEMPDTLSVVELELATTPWHQSNAITTRSLSTHAKRQFEHPTILHRPADPSNDGII